MPREWCGMSVVRVLHIAGHGPAKAVHVTVIEAAHGRTYGAAVIVHRGKEGVGGGSLRAERTETLEPCVEEHIRQLEERLLQPEVRKSVAEVAMLLAPAFIEFGSSGRMFTKSQIIEALQCEEPARRSLVPTVLLGWQKRQFMFVSRASCCADWYRRALENADSPIQSMPMRLLPVLMRIYMAPCVSYARE